MTTTATKMPLADAIGPELQARTARRSAMDALRAAPRKARAWLASTMHALKLDGLAESASHGLGWLVSKIRSAGRFLKGLGLLNLVGFVLTWRSARELAVKVAAKAYRVVRKPFELIHRGLNWLFGKVGFTWGQKQLAKAAERGQRLENWVAGKVRKGMDWLDKHDQHPVMRGLRMLFGGSVITRGVAGAFPDAPSWTRYAAGATFAGVTDQATKEAVESEEAAIAKAKVVLAEVTVTEQPASDGSAPKGRPTPKRPSQAKAKVPSMTSSVVILTDSDLDTADRTFEAIAFTDENGVRRIRLGSQLLLEDDLPESITVVGENLGEVGELVQDAEKRVENEAQKLEQEVRSAQASPKGKPPTLPTAPRAGARAAEKKAPAGRRRK